ncbi:MAG: alginate export family protein [Rhodospirillaceae bacterium]|nr:alginate export family protein [Rhodospirillaceae bacterium]
MLKAITLCVFGAMGLPTTAQASESLSDAILNSRPIINARYRYEGVDQDGFTEYARASTLRTRVGFETQRYKGLSALLDFENISAIGNELFNDTVNARSQFPIVADPNITELNQAYLNFDGVFDTAVRLGRQRINLDNQRFVGAVGFRQNEQTFDAISITNQSINDTSLRYIYIDNVNRIFGDDSQVGDFKSNSHLVNVKYSGLQIGTLVGYGYFLDLENAPAFSSKTYGARFTGRWDFNFNHDLSLLYAIEIAHQRPHADNSNDFDHNYFLFEPGVRLRDLKIKLGYESMDGNGTNAFQTPLATLHAFNGVTDRLLVTPSNGIEDIYAKIHYAFEPVKWLEGITLSGAYHYLNFEQTSGKIGTEWSTKIALKLTRNVSISLEQAQYNAQSVSVDTNKTWVTLQYIF